MRGCTWRRSPRATAGRAAVLLVVVIACRFWLEPLQSYYSSSSNYHHQHDDDGHPDSEFEAIRASQNSNSQRRGAGLCSEIDLSVFAPGKACGLPLSAPCFDSTRCSGALSSLPRPMMYVYDNRCSLANSSLLGNATTYHEDERDMSGAIWRTAAANAGLLAETYESACLFVHVNERVDHEPCASRAPLWNEGSNHVMVDLTDFSRVYRPTVAASFAMEAAVNVRTCFYRSGYDISVPLAPKSIFPELATVHPLGRRFFLAFKGTVYISGGGGSAERMPLVPLHDPGNGIAVVMHCFEVHGAHLLPENVDFCANLKSTYGKYTYSDVMNTTFALVPAGRSPASFRLGEVMSAGAIPVFVSKNIVRPFAEELDWSAFSFAFSPDQAGSEMVKALRAVPREEIETMQRKSLEAYNMLFGNSTYSYDTVARNVVEVLERRLKHHRK